MLEKKEISINPDIVWKALLIFIAVAFIFIIRDILILLFLVIILASVITPFVEKLEQKKIPRPAGAGLAYLLLFGVIGILIYLLAPIVSQEINHLIANFPQYLNNIVLKYNLELNLQQMLGGSSEWITGIIANAFSNTFNLFKNLIGILVVFSLSFYTVVKKEGINSFLEMLIPDRYLSYIIKISNRVQYKIGRWLIGQLFLGVIVFCLDYIVLSMLNVPYALVLAIFGGILEIIPYIGPIVSGFIAVLVALSVSPLIAFFTGISLFIIQQVENHILVPLIMKRAVGLNPVLVILALLIGGKLAGVLGFIIAVPFATMISVVLKDLYSEKTSNV